MARPAYDPLKTYRFKSSAFPFEAAAKVPATLDAEDVTGNLPAEVKAVASEAGYLLQSADTGDTTVARKGSGSHTLTALGTVASVTGNVGGNVAGKVIGGGSGTITGTGARVVDAAGNNVAPASTALSNVTWTDARAGYIDKLNVTGTLAHSDAAATYKATGFATPTNVTDARDAVIAQGNAEWKTATGFLASLGSTAPAGWLNAAAFATDAISAAAVSAAAVTKLQTGLATQTSVDLSKSLLDRIIVPVGGTSSGSPDGTEIFEYGNVRMTSTVDSSGNRSSVVWEAIE